MRIPASATIRETFEETGLKIGSPTFCGVLVETSPTNYNWICFVYLAEINYVVPPVCNEGELEWIAYSELLDVPTPQTDWYIYKYLIEQKPFMFNARYDDQLRLRSMQEEIEKTSLSI
jgi:8-oxo-dGTP diphosphatase